MEDSDDNSEFSKYSSLMAVQRLVYWQSVNRVDVTKNTRQRRSQNTKQSKKLLEARKLGGEMGAKACWKSKQSKLAWEEGDRLLKYTGEDNWGQVCSIRLPWVVQTAEVGQKKKQLPCQHFVKYVLHFSYSKNLVNLQQSYPLIITYHLFLFIHKYFVSLF